MGHINPSKSSPLSAILGSWTVFSRLNPTVHVYRSHICSNVGVLRCFGGRRVSQATILNVTADRNVKRIDLVTSRDRDSYPAFNFKLIRIRFVLQHTIYFRSIRVTDTIPMHFVLFGFYLTIRI